VLSRADHGDAEDFEAMGGRRRHTSLLHSVH